MRMGEAARLLGLCERTLRNWDAQGKLRPCGRTAGGHRLYDRETLLKLMDVVEQRERARRFAEAIRSFKVEA